MMKIRLKLFATLTDLLPAGAYQNSVDINIPDNVSLNWLIDHYKVPRELAHLVLVNGLFHCDADRDQLLLKTGDTVAIWPPVAGG
jgi:molybdopterin converting factor small subunit